MQHRLIHHYLATLSDGVAKDVFNISNSGGVSASGRISRWEVTCTDATGSPYKQTATGTASWTVSNRGGAFDSQITSTLDETSKDDATDTLAVAWAITGANPAVVSCTVTTTGMTATVTIELDFDLEQGVPTPITLLV